MESSFSGMIWLEMSCWAVPYCSHFFFFPEIQHTEKAFSLPSPKDVILSFDACLTLSCSNAFLCEQDRTWPHINSVLVSERFRCWFESPAYCECASNCAAVYPKVEHKPQVGNLLKGIFDLHISEMMGKDSSCSKFTACQVHKAVPAYGKLGCVSDSNKGSGLPLCFSAHPPLQSTEFLVPTNTTLSEFSLLFCIFLIFSEPGGTTIATHAPHITARYK